MFARGFLCFCRAPLPASRQNSPKSNDSPIYAPLSRMSNDSPTYAKTGGWGVFSAQTFKYHLKCRRADISPLTEILSAPARRSFSGRGPLSSHPTTDFSFQSVTHSFIFHTTSISRLCNRLRTLSEKTGGTPPCMVIPTRRRAGLKDQRYIEECGEKSGTSMGLVGGGGCELLGCGGGF